MEGIHSILDSIFDWIIYCFFSFNCSDYVRGAKVKLRLHDWEISSRFLGSTTDMTLKEADATLMGLIWSPLRSANQPAISDVKKSSETVKEKPEKEEDYIEI